MTRVTRRDIITISELPETQILARDKANKVMKEGEIGTPGFFVFIWVAAPTPWVNPDLRDIHMRD